MSRLKLVLGESFRLPRSLSFGIKLANSLLPLNLSVLRIANRIGSGISNWNNTLAEVCILNHRKSASPRHPETVSNLKAAIVRSSVSSTSLSIARTPSLRVP